MYLPIRKINQIFHWGSLDPKNVGENGSSHEGNCLSASLCPEAWLGIAKLGNNPLHAMSSPCGIFVDLYALMERDEFCSQRKAMLDDLLASGHIESGVGFKVWGTNEEGEPRYATYSTRNEAEYEAEFGGDEDATIEEVLQLVGTQLLIDQLGITPQSALMCGEEYGLISWLRQRAIEGAAIDGVFFNDDFDPLYLSAPIFAVFPERVPRWGFSPAELDVDDEDRLKAMPDIKAVDMRVSFSQLSVSP
jgi:hypothetical protein